MSCVFLGLGSNRGERVQHLQSAVDRLHRYDGVEGIAVSPVYETEAHTKSPEEVQPRFLNAVFRVRTRLTPAALLHAVQAVEHAEGRRRQRGGRWRPRRIDVDILAVGAVTRQTDTLTLPHPRLGERRFVLRPWADIAPDFRVPRPFDAPVRALLAACSDPAAVARTDMALFIPGLDAGATHRFHE